LVRLGHHQRTGRDRLARRARRRGLAGELRRPVRHRLTRSISGRNFDTSGTWRPCDTWLWTLPDLTLEQQAFRPDHVRAIWPEEQGLASPVERLTIEAASMTSELDLQPGADFALDASDTVLTDVTVTSDAGWRMALPEGRLSMIRQEGQDARYDVTFAARDLAPPVPTPTARPGGILPETIETLDYTAEMEFDRPWDLRAIEDRRPQITTLDLRR
jgi:hypothetical protein